MKPRSLLLILAAVGLILHFLTRYTPFHPQLLISTIAVILFVIYLLTVPVVLWLLRKERFLCLLLSGI